MAQLLSIFYRFFILGLMSFGGPAAHIGYFQNTFVKQLKWLSQEDYAHLISLSQILPGPGSSQVGFGIGLKQAGLIGGCTAFIAFTLPSFVIMFLLACVSGELMASAGFDAIIHALKLMAIIIVADACISMFKSFCKQQSTILIALLSALLMSAFPFLIAQIAVLAIAATFGFFLYKSEPDTNPTTQVPFEKNHKSALVLFITIFISLPFIIHLDPRLDLFNVFYQAGSLVFGGGHVVLPLLQNTIGNELTTDQFLAGYAAAQAIPGPMFTFATYLGALLVPSAPLIGASIATLGVFIPGFLLMYCFINHWKALLKNSALAGIAWGLNAAVVGLLLAALQSLSLNAIVSLIDVAWVVVGFAVWYKFKPPILLFVLTFITLGLGQAALL